jgi:hypothetical protein
VPGHDAEEFGGELYNELLALTESSWSRWNHALEHVPSESLSTPGVCGIWSVKDLIGHIAVWDDVAVQKIGRLAGGEGPHADDDVHTFNGRESSLRADRSVEEQFAEMRRNHERLLGALEGASRASDDDLAEVRQWIAADTWEHYDEHTAQVTASFPAPA